MSHGVHGKRRRAASDWVVRPLEGRVLLSQAGVHAPASVPHAVGSLETMTVLRASTVMSRAHPKVTLTATVTSPGLNRPLGGGLVRFTVVSPTPEVLGSAHSNSRGSAKLTTSRLNLGENYVIQAQFRSSNGTFAGSTDQLDVTASPPQVVSFRITAPQYYGAPGTPVTFAVTALNRAGRPVRDYTGTVQFVSPTDHSAKFLTRTYTFTTADQGSHAFLDGVTFHKGGAEVLKVAQVNNTRISASQPFGIE